MMPSRLSLPPRDRHEGHRVSTPLELLFDLASVIAIAAAAGGLHHAISEGHATEGVVGFGMTFFAIWWAWMNYTWFASAYDNGKTWFRVVTMIIILGALILAAGIPSMMEGKSFLLLWSGFVVMRLGQVTLWLSAARGDPQRRTTGLRYAAGILLAQLYWSLFLFTVPMSNALFVPGFLIGMLLELTVPVVAEHGSNTPWHRHHIIERYGLMTIIVLGECMLAVANAFRSTGGVFSITSPLLHIALSGAAITFAMWWAYFTREEHIATEDHRRSFVWGYGHAVLFAAVAAVGAGIAVLVDVVTRKASISLRAADIAVAIPLALYFATLWVVRDRFLTGDWRRNCLLVGALAILVIGIAMPLTLELMTAAAVVTAALRGNARGLSTSG